MIWEKYVFLPECLSFHVYDYCKIHIQSERNVEVFYLPIKWKPRKSKEIREKQYNRLLEADITI